MATSRGQWKTARHLDLLNDALVDVALGKTPRLLITMPPRHGKSLLTSQYFPAWYLGNYPARRVILASYEADFAAGWGRKARDLLEEHGPSLFGISIRKDSKAADRWEIAHHGGGMITAGVGGAITGRGSNILIIDDPVKNAEEANSETYREKTWEWYTSTAYTRLEPGGAVILIMTRWHEGDLAGRILAQQSEPTSDSWRVLNLPALAEDRDALGRAPGEPLWPERFTALDFSRIRQTIGGYFFSALYGQRPTPAEGGLFKRSWFRSWARVGDFYALGAERKLIRPADCRRFGIVDLAFSTKKEADYTVISAWAATHEHDLILLDLIRERMEGPALVPALQEFSARHDLAYLGIEAVSAQVLVVQAARQAGLTVRPLKAETDKISRSVPAQVRMEGGQIFFPTAHAELAQIEAELLAFPRGVHDDIVDNVSYAALEVQRFGGAAEPEDVREARETAMAQAEQARREASDRAARADIDDPRWWSGGGWN